MGDVRARSEHRPAQVVRGLRELPLLERDPRVVDVEIGRRRIAEVDDLVDNVDGLTDLAVFLRQLFVEEDERRRARGAQKQQRQHSFGQKPIVAVIFSKSGAVSGGEISEEERGRGGVEGLGRMGRGHDWGRSECLRVCTSGADDWREAAL